MPISLTLALGAAALLGAALATRPGAPPKPHPLAAPFRSPEQRYRPETWFHFIGGNITREGITADLEAIAGAGIAGVQLFNGHFGGAWPGIPQVACLTPEWDAMVGHVGSECARLGLRFAMQGCPGWAEAGGPWVPVEQGMRHLVTSRTDVPGGPVDVMLPRPGGDEPWRDYRDVAVLAFPTPADDTGRPLTPASVSGPGDAARWRAVAEGQGGVELAPGRHEVEIRFAGPVTVRSLELPSVAGMTHGREFTPGIEIEVLASRAGAFQPVARRAAPRANWQDAVPLTLALPETRSDAFRLVFHLSRPITLSSLRLFGGARTDDWEGRAGYTLRALDPLGVMARPADACIDPARLVDISAHADAAGHLRWDAPAGAWTVVRFGHVFTGARNGPAPPEATGPEVDKFDPAAVRNHFDSYIGRLSRPGGPAGGLLHGLLFDSWECQSQTWTPAMERLFAEHRGYALRQWLPALAGWVVGDTPSTERFLRDWRCTQSDLISKAFYGEIARLARERGLTSAFETAIGDVMTGDILQYMSAPDTPMCEFWWPDCPQRGGDETKPILPTASAAHIYGKQRIAAESLTSVDLHYDESFFTWKPTLDRALSQGVNHVVFHTYTHNPRMGIVPGTSFGAGIGSPFLRGQTWWPRMRAFTDYVARCEFMLQQGRPVADVLWFLGDEVDHKPRQDTPFPAGVRFDYCNPDALQRRMAGAPGAIRSPEGLEWRLLWLRERRATTPETLEAILRIVKAGGAVLGAPPNGCASLTGGAASARRIAALTRALWGANPEPAGDRRVGAGRVLWGVGLADALARLQVVRDVTGPSELRWCHRRTDDCDLYFAAAGSAGAIRGPVEFRAAGLAEILDPMTGETRPAPVLSSAGGSTTIWLDLEIGQSVFVTFRKGRKNPAIARVEFDGQPIIGGGNPARPAQPRVISAVYAAIAAPALRVDVTAAVRRVLAAGQPIVAGNGLGGDPALGKPKILTLRVQTADGERTIQASEGKMISLEPGNQPLRAVTLTDRAQPVAWRNGVVRLTGPRGGVREQTVSGARSVALAGPWTLELPAGWGADAPISLPTLAPWSDLDHPEARWFSGAGIYATEFEIDQPVGGARFLLDLGEVASMALVTLNDRPLPLSWAPPHRLDVTRLVRSGRNRLRVEVTNTWRNRLSYDAALPEPLRKTWTISGPGPQTRPDRAGLVGPVTLHVGRVVRPSGAARADWPE